MKACYLFLLISCCVKYQAHGQKTTRNIDSTATSKINAGNDGSSYEKAVIILQKTEGKGEDAEYAWLQKKYPGYKSEMQKLIFYHGKPYDLFQLTTVTKKEVTAYFDISNFYGKL